MESGEPSLTSSTMTSYHLPQLQQPLLRRSSSATTASRPSNSPVVSNDGIIVVHQQQEEDAASSFLIFPSSTTPDDDDPHSPLTLTENKKKIHRCRTAPAMAVMQDLIFTSQQQDLDHYQHKPQSDGSAYLVRQAAVLLILYLTLGILIYYFNRHHFSGIDTHPFVDALYFCIVTMCTIGYGDIAPLSPPAKLFSCFFVLVGFGIIDIVLSGVVNYVLDYQEKALLHVIEHPNSPKKKGHHHHHHHHHLPTLSASGAGTARIFSPTNYIFDFAKGRMRIRLKVALALCAVLMSIGIGTLVLYSVEDLDWIDSLYLSVMSVTTVGYGDRAFKTLPGRLFASIWLLFSTLAVARAFLYLAEARIDKRHRRINNWVLHRQITVDDLLAANINQNGFISKSEYVIFKLKEMGMIAEKDISQICDQFNKLDHSNCGKITLADLLESRLYNTR